MNRADFMKQLESLLQNISQAEREEALQYYNDYFDDAGPANEQAVMEALGNPAKVAENIKRDLFGNGFGENVKVTAGDRVVIPYGEAAKTGAEERDFEKESEREGGMSAATGDTAEKHAKNSDSGKLSHGLIALIVVLAVLASPVLLSVASGVLAVIVGILAGWFSLILGLGAATIALFVSALALSVVAVLCVFFHPLVGVALLGGGLLCAGVGILLMMLTVAMAGVATPAVWKGLVSLTKKLTGRRVKKG